MVVDEKGLISDMKAAYKTTGYKVAVDESEGSVDYIIDGLSWAVVIEKGSLPAKVFGLIAEHIRDSVNVGQAYQVRKKDIQTMIFGLMVEDVRNIGSDGEARRIIRRTNLTLGGCPLWQGVTDQKVIRVLPEYEEIMLWGGNTPVRMIGDDVIHVADESSAVYIRFIGKNETNTELLGYLSQVALPAI